MPKTLVEKVQARFGDDAHKRAEEGKVLWDKSQPKRELASYILQKLTKDDEVAQHLIEEADKTSLELSKTTLDVPLIHQVTANTEDFAPVGITLSSLNFTSAKSSPDIEISNSTPGNNTSWSITTDNHRGPKSVAAMFFSQVQPPPGSGRMTVTAHPDIVYSYGNHAFLVHSHTHAWIGFLVREWDSNGNLVQTNKDDQGNIFDLTTDDDYSSRGQPSLQVPNIPVVDNHIYVIGVQCGGDVESSKRSYANLSMSVPNIFVNFA